MTYYDATKDITINKEGVWWEIVKICQMDCLEAWDEFITEMGDKEEYKADDVLMWLNKGNETC